VSNRLATHVDRSAAGATEQVVEKHGQPTETVDHGRAGGLDVEGEGEREDEHGSFSFSRATESSAAIFLVRW